MSAPTWPVVVSDELANSIEVRPYAGGVSVYVGGITGDCVCLDLTPAQSATLRAALEAAEQEMK